MTQIETTLDAMRAAESAAAERVVQLGLDALNDASVSESFGVAARAVAAGDAAPEAAAACVLHAFEVRLLVRRALPRTANPELTLAVAASDRRLREHQDAMLVLTDEDYEGAIQRAATAPLGAGWISRRLPDEVEEVGITPAPAASPAGGSLVAFRTLAANRRGVFAVAVALLILWGPSTLLRHTLGTATDILFAGADRQQGSDHARTEP